ncbi:hypothetical protein BKA70DRAFT_1283531 [Coprinopsis sp. MPI-PUGE-AT-0042]|nr:hypothetical protein BKA70DRAFT_1283531 [Coprinopsis sp. MPI-PUGE-AT-0042]
MEPSPFAPSLSLSASLLSVSSLLILSSLSSNTALCRSIRSTLSLSSLSTRSLSTLSRSTRSLSSLSPRSTSSSFGGVNANLRSAWISCKNLSNVPAEGRGLPLASVWGCSGVVEVVPVGVEVVPEGVAVAEVVLEGKVEEALAPPPAALLIKLEFPLGFESSPSPILNALAISASITSRGDESGGTPLGECGCGCTLGNREGVEGARID